ncbi:MAG: hypothetical protein WBG43_13120 [Marinifilaceae bacterium]
MISGKDKKIVAAVFASRGNISIMNGGSVLKCLKKTGHPHNKGDYSTGHRAYSNEYWEFICTIEEYFQCIEDMARAEWLSGSVFSHYRFYKVNCESKGIDTSNKELLKENCDYSFYDKPLVYTQDMVDSEIPVSQGLKYLDGSGQYCRCLAHVYSNTDKRGKVIGHMYEHPNNGFIPAISISDYSEIRPIKTPDQIKQDKLDAHLNEIDKYLTNEGVPVDRIWLEMLQAKGYIVEPK